MKTKAICSFFVLFALAAVVVGTTTTTVPAAYANHQSIRISIPEGAATPECQETNECYIPYKVIADVGSTVTWSNDDTAAHTVTAGSPA